jgi:hypothetical protein
VFPNSSHHGRDKSHREYADLTGVEICPGMWNMLKCKTENEALTLIDFRNKVELIHDTDLIEKYFHKIPEYLWESALN